MSRLGFALTICIALIFAMGVLMVFNTTAAEVLDRSLDLSTHHALFRQIFYAILGATGGLLFWKIGYENAIRYSGFFLSFGTLLLLLVFIPGIGQMLNGAHRWLRVGSFSIQPSEFVKYFIPLYYIQWITTQTKAISMFDFLKLLCKLAIPMSLILIEPDNGTVAIILAALVVLFLLTRIRWIYWGLPLLLLVCLGGIVASQMPHAMNRIRIYLNPELDLQGKGHQPYQAKIAAGSGKLWGKGLGESLQKLDYLPEARSDYIAAIYAEEFGFIGVLLLITLYLILGFIGYYIAASSTNIQAFYMVSIFTFLICFQAFLNLGVVSGLLPSKGVNLPFFSQGGSSLIANSIALALILNSAKKTCQKNAF